ncbi:MAG TPA: metal-dependent hydrolase [Gammaproteobacteria bacterium]|nr:metal-dependent hydrolase [Gammaproteobacteria bacterium]
MTTHLAPKDHVIQPRPAKFNITEKSPRYWFDNDPFRTHFFNAFLTTFPPGETFFVRSVLDFRHLVTDDDLQQQISDFCSQEGNHAHAHDLHADILGVQGYSSIARDNRFLDWGLHQLNRWMPKFSLAITIAIEHFTAILAHQVYSAPELFIEPAHEDFKPMFQWHAAEEIEHKAVAYDVYQAVDGHYGKRITAMVLTTIGILMIMFVRLFPLLRKDGLLWNWSTWKNGMPFLVGKNGLLRRPLHHYFQFYKRDFHPWEVDDYYMIQEFREQYDSGEFLSDESIQTA